MRSEDPSRSVISNGHTASSNGSTPRKLVSSSVNGSSPVRNGSSPTYTNGTNKTLAVPRSPLYRGHNREELTRILIQGLADMGYADAAHTLSRESGFDLESPAAAAFRSSIRDGNWTEAERILLGSPVDGGGGGGSAPPNLNLFGDGLILAEGASKEQMLFWIRQQKFLELLDQRDLGQALLVLRQDLAPLDHDVHQLHILSSLLMCPPEDLREQAHWPETLEESRSELLQDLTKCIAPSVMIRDHRLAELLDQVKEAQINQCLYHNTSAAPSLYSDHVCNREDFPSRTWTQLSDHSAEVWHVQFSYDGSKLATASKDKSVIIYETTTFSVLYKLNQHTTDVTFVSWSPDDKKLITCEEKGKGRVWDVSSGRLMVDLEHGPSEGSHGITSAAWAPDSNQFVTTSHDSRAPLCLWRLNSSNTMVPLHTWTTSDPRNLLRCPECAITPDGQRLLAVDTKCGLHVYDLATQKKLYHFQFSSKLTSINVSRDCRTALVNLEECEIHLFDIEAASTIRKFKGQKQGSYIIRSCFGGAAENFILSGSEDGKVYIWHKENSALIETLRGHARGGQGNDCVTTVAWNPKDAGMFASGGDDRKVRIWTNSTASNESLMSSIELHTRHESSRTSALRSTYGADNNS